jgi:hypothetical protein
VAEGYRVVEMGICGFNLATVCLRTVGLSIRTYAICSRSIFRSMMVLEGDAWITYVWHEKVPKVTVGSRFAYPSVMDAESATQSGKIRRLLPKL